MNQLVLPSSGLITRSVLDKYPSVIYVYGENSYRSGIDYSGQLIRTHERSYGFIVKRTPGKHFKSFYSLDDYKQIFKLESKKLENVIRSYSDRFTYLIQDIGSSTHEIYRNLLEPYLTELERTYDNVYVRWANQKHGNTQKDSMVYVLGRSSSMSISAV